jgi:hypothetical protein
MTLKIFASSALALAMLTGSAAAVTVTNNSDEEIKIGVDRGSSEKVETIGAGKSAKLDCKDQCGVTGPWGFSWMAKGDDTIKTNGKSLVTVTKS